MQVFYLGQLVKVVKVIKYLGLNFADDRCCSPSVEHLIITAERTRHAVQNRISNMGGLSPKLNLRLGLSVICSLGLLLLSVARPGESTS